MAGRNNDVFSSSMGSKSSRNGTTTEKKKRKRPSKKVPTTVLEASSTNFMNLVQKLTGSAAELAAAKAEAEKRACKPVLEAPNSGSPSPYPSPYSSPSGHVQQDDRPSSDTYYQRYLRNTGNNMAYADDDSSSHNNYPSSNAAYSTNAAHYNMPVIPVSLDDYQQVAHGTSSAMAYSYGPGTSASRQYVESESRVSPADVDDEDLYHYSAGRSGSMDASNALYPSSSRAMEYEISPYSSWPRADQMNHSDYWYQVDQVPAMRA